MLLPTCSGSCCTPYNFILSVVMMSHLRDPSIVRREGAFDAATQQKVLQTY
jgi:hypothetical protein